MKKNKFKIILAFSLLAFSCLCAFCLLTLFVPFFPNISKIIAVRQAESKYLNSAVELCQDTIFVKDIHDLACNDLTYVQQYGKYTVASRRMEKITLNNTSRMYIYKRLVLRAESDFNFPCPSCDETTIDNSYYLAFQIGNTYVGETHFNIKDQSTIVDLNEDILNVQATGDRYNWILFYNSDILDSYQLFSIDKTTNKVESLAIKLEGKISFIRLDPNAQTISYQTNGEDKSMNIDLDSATEVLNDLGPMYPLQQSTGNTIKSEVYSNIAKSETGYTIYSFQLPGEPQGAKQPYLIYYSIVPTGSVYDDPNVVTMLPATDNYSGLKAIGITYEDLKVILNNLPSGQKVFWGKQDFETTQDYKFVLPFEKSIRELENVCKINNLVCNFKFI